ncbi:MAG: putative glycosyltransferase, group 1 [Hyphomicrobiales bacterium]|nr:putative glycosyltransferase, group 1 [Hyphomicrobiales bacterium]
MSEALIPAPARVLVTTDSVGGVWTYAATLATALRAAGLSPTLAVLGPSPSAAQLSMAQDVRVIDTGAALDWQARSRAEIAAAADVIATLASSTGCDCLQLHSPAYLAFGSFSVPAVAVMHSCVGTWWSAVRGGGLPEDLAWRCELVKDGLLNAEIALAPTASFARDVARFYSVPAPKVVSNALPMQPASVEPAMAPAGSVFAFTAGRLWDEAKAVHTLDEAAALIDMPVYAAGATTSGASDDNVFRHLHPLGPLGAGQMRYVLARRPIFVSTSVYEPFGLSILEAADAGCALVLSDIPTLRELWQGAALFFPPRDAAALAAQLACVRHDVTLRDDLGRKASARSAAFSAGLQAERMMGIYRNVFRARRRAEAAA